jgi:hypothetical protein
MVTLPHHVKIKEDSWLARLAAARLKTKQVAMVVGDTIYLYGVTRHRFLQNLDWVAHELKHVEQYRRLGLLRFFALYAWYTVLHGYYQNPLEKEARGEKIHSK